MRFTALALIIAVTFAPAGARRALADWPTDPSVNLPVCTATNSQSQPQIVPDSAGGAIIAWYDARNGAQDLFAQRVTAAGATAWAAGGVPVCVANGNQDGLAMVADNSGGAVLAWSDGRNISNAVYAQRISGTGARAWAAAGVVLCKTDGYQLATALTPDGAGGAIAAWMDVRNGVGNFIYAQRILANGAKAWTANGVKVSTDSGVQYDPAVLGDGSGGVFIGWSAYRDNSNDIYVQHISAAGAVTWNPMGMPVCRAPDSQSWVALASDGSGGVFVSWTDYRSGNFDVYAQHVLASGAPDPAWPTNGLGLAVLAGEQSVTSIVADGAGGAIVVWGDHRGNNYDVYAQRVSAGGATQWAANGIPVCTSPGDQLDIRACRGSTGDVIVSWTEIDPNDIRAQRLNLSGACAWPAHGSPVSTAAGGQSSSAICPDGSGGVVAAWTDTRSDAVADIYAQLVPASGLVDFANAPSMRFAGAVTWTVGAATPLLLYLTSNSTVDAMHGYAFTNARHWPNEVAEDSVFVPAGGTVALPFTLVAPDTAANGTVSLAFTAWSKPEPSATANFTPQAFMSPIGLGVANAGARRLAIRAVRAGATGAIVKLALDTIPTEPVTIDLFDITGRLLANARAFPRGDGFTVEPGHALASGVYLVRVIQAGSSATARFVVAR